jgi:pyruvate formate lyase activating enzyme
LDGIIFNTQHFSIHDGPGIRTTVFLKGCNLRCYWCHNPESQNTKPEIQRIASKCVGCGACLEVCPQAENGTIALFSEHCLKCGACADVCYADAISRVGYSVSSEKLFEEISGDLDVYQKSGGGVTFSGGEPLLQPDFLLEVLKLCKQAGIHTAIETAALVPWETLERVLPYLDLVLCDLKILDEQKHRSATGQSNVQILKNIQKMSERGTNLIVRTPVIPEFNDNEEAIRAISDFVSSLPNHPSLELLPFHNLCAGKYEALNRIFKARNLQEPKAEQMEQLRRYL